MCGCASRSLSSDIHSFKDGLEMAWKSAGRAQALAPGLQKAHYDHRQQGGVIQAGDLVLVRGVAF